MRFFIRKVNGKKLAIESTLLDLQKEILPSDLPLSPKCGHWWIAYLDTGKPVGFCSISRSVTWRDAGYLCRAGVLDAYTGHALQKRLIQVRIRKAIALGWNWLITDTTNNPASSNSLINCGFKIYKPRNPWANKESIYWRLKLREKP